MKISKLFHTLYAFLMFLPVMVLPLFAININQKEVEPLTAQIEETQVVDFNQFAYVNTLEFHTVDFDNEMPTAFNVTVNYHFKKNNIYYFKYTLSEFLTSNVRNVLFLETPTWVQFSSVISNVNGNMSFAMTNDQNLNSNYFYSRFTFDDDLTADISYWCAKPNVDVVIFNYQFFNLTQMFGSGNEPTIQQFDLWYSENDYSYTLSNKQILYTGVIDTLNNTDVGSQFLYSLYNPLKDYFNLPNYMNLGGLYDWFLVNLFSGYNTPVYFIIFTLMLYWLALSLLWLIFDVLMYVPSMIHKMLDKARME